MYSFVFRTIIYTSGGNLWVSFLLLRQRNVGVFLNTGIAGGNQLVSSNRLMMPNLCDFESLIVFDFILLT